MDDCRSESDFTKSTFSTKKTMLSKVKKKKRIHVPISFNKSRSFNASLNSTFSKVSLSANNRALARALQVKKEQLYNAVQVVQQMQINEQKYLQELASSKELITKMKKTVEDMEKAQGKVFVSLNRFIEDLTKTVDIYSTLQKSFSDFLGNTSPNISATESPAYPQLASADFINKRRPKRWLNKPARVLATPEDRTNLMSDSKSPKTSTSQSSVDKDSELPECLQTSVTLENVAEATDQSKQKEDDLQPLASYTDIPYPCSSAPDLSMITEQSFLQDIPSTVTFTRLRGEKHQSSHKSAIGESATETPLHKTTSQSRSSLNRRQTRVISRNSIDSVKLTDNTKTLEDMLGECHDLVTGVPKEVDTDKNSNKNCQSVDNTTRTSAEPTAQNTRSRSRKSLNRRMTGVVSNNKTDLLKLSEEKKLLDDKLKRDSDAVTLSAENVDTENRLINEGASECIAAERNHATCQLPDVMALDCLQVKETETTRDSNTRCTRSRSRSCLDRRRTRTICTTEYTKLGEDRKQLESKSRSTRDIIRDAPEKVDGDSRQTSDNNSDSKRNHATHLSTAGDGLEAKKTETGTELGTQPMRSRSQSCTNRRQTRVLHRNSTELMRKNENCRDLDIGILEQCLPVFDTSEDMTVDAQNTTALNSSHPESPDAEDGSFCGDSEPKLPLNFKSSGSDELRKADVLVDGQMYKGDEQKLRAGFQSSEVTICDVQDMELTEVISAKDLEKIAVPSFIKENSMDEPSFLKSMEEQNCIQTESIPDPEKVSYKNFNDDQVNVKKSRLPQPQGFRKSRKQLKSDDLGKKTDTKEKKKAAAVTEKPSKNVTVQRNGKQKEEARTEQSNSQKMSVSDTDSSCQSDSEGEAVMKRYMAYLVKPGKISFTAGRKNCSDLIGNNTTQQSRSKSRSILPTMQKSRSKSRSKSNMLNSQPATKSSDTKGSGAKCLDVKGSNSVFEFISPRSRRRNSGSPKHPADISLSESTSQPKPSYSQFCGREMPHPKQTIPAVCDSEEVIITDSPHGIMLVLANGRRTKPRSKVKSVHYKREIQKIIPPENYLLEACDVDNMEKEQSAEDVSVACIRPMAVDAGNTPVRHPVRKKSIREEGFRVPESPVVGEGAVVVGDGVLAVDVNLKQFSLDVPNLVTDDQCFSYDSPIVRRKAVRQRQQQLISSSSEEEVSETWPATKKKQFSTKMDEARVTKSRHSLQQPRQQREAEKPHQEEEVIHGKKRNTTTISSTAPSKAGQVRGHLDQTENALDAEPHDINGIVSKTEPKQQVSEAKSAAVTPPAKQQSWDHQELKNHNDRDEETEKENIPETMKESSCQQEEAAPRKRRAAAAVKSYKEPVINKKLRRGDDHTSTIYGEQELERFKSEINKKMKKKRSTIGKTKQESKDGVEHSEEERKRRALATISNTCSSSDSS